MLVALAYRHPYCQLSPQVTSTGAMAILESQDITSDTELGGLLAVADTLRQILN